VIRNQKGFLLIDACVALIFLGTMIIAIATAFPYVARNAATNEKYNQALLLAKNEVEKLRLGDGTAYIKPTPTSPTTVQGTEYTIIVDDTMAVSNLTSYNTATSPASYNTVHPNRVKPVKFTVTWKDVTWKVVKDNVSKIELVGYHYE
jgi:Tfp pilus assembly protein PilV